MVTSATYWLVLLGSFFLYWLLPARYRVPFLALASFGYLLTEDWWSVSVLLVWSIAFYRLAPLAHGRERFHRNLLAGLVLSILGYLAYFKYVPPLLLSFSTNPISKEILLPLGISYFTFKLIHYAIETSRGNIKEHSLGLFLVYVFLFPIFFAGPIERFDNLLRSRDERLSRQAVAEGLTRIIHGLIKKFAIAEGMILPFLAQPGAAAIFEDLEGTSVRRAWLHVVLYFAYAYLDFAAYSDIAIGSSRLFGIRIIENFNFPFAARSINDFWQRWHMSLSGWCRAYVYMPTIGLTRNPYLATYATMATIGLWHEGSLTWLSWGLYHATGIVIYGSWSRFRRRRKWLPRPGVVPTGVGIGLTMLFVSGSYVFPVAADHGGVVSAIRLFLKLFGVTLPAP